MTVIGILGILAAFVLLIYMIMKGVNIFLTAFLCVVVVAVTGQIGLYEAFKVDYMTGFADFFKANFLIFLTGTLLGKAMDVTGAAKGIAKLIVRILGDNLAFISVPLACGILCFGGVSAFVCSFAVFPIALQVFRAADLPRNYIPAALCFGCSTFAMVAPGAPQIHNTIPAATFETPISAGLVNGALSCGVMLIMGIVWLNIMLKKQKAAGAHFVPKPMDDFGSHEEQTPNGLLALVPLIVCICLINIKINGAPIAPVEVGVLAGVVLTILLFHRYIDTKQIPEFFMEGCKTSITSITNTCAVVGFGNVVRHSAVFNDILHALLHIPGPTLLGLCIGTTVIAGICGSASGGLGIACPLLGPAYVAQGVLPAVAHRVMSLSSAALDSLPHNGYIVTVTNGLCNETHKDAYMPIFKLTVVTPFIGSLVGVLLFTLFPILP